jgi:transcription elongation factor Elf1
MMETKEPKLETFPGARYWRSMQGSVDAILTPIGEKRRVLSMGTQFVNYDAWTGEKFAHVLCDFLAKNPTRMPNPRELRDLIGAANSARCHDPHIRVARMPERVTLRVARAIIGGGYHEAFHTKYSKRDRVRQSEVLPILDIAEQVTLAGGQFDAKMRGLIMTLHHLVEDIRIERRGNEDFDGAKQAMVDLQDFILDLETIGRKKGAKVKNVTVSMNARSILLCAFRDLGLGYNSHKAREMIEFYKTHAPGAISLLAPGGILAPMVHESKTLGRDDKMGSLRVAMKVVVELWRATQQEPEDDEQPAMQCPQCGAGAKDLVIRSVKNDQGIKVKGRAEMECKVCGFKTEFDLPDNSLNLNQQEKEQDEEQETPEVEDLDQDDVGEGSDGFGDDTREKMRDQKPEEQKPEEGDDSKDQQGGDANPVPVPGEPEEQEGGDGDEDSSEEEQEGSDGESSEETSDDGDEDSEDSQGGASDDEDSDSSEDGEDSPEEGLGDEADDESDDSQSGASDDEETDSSEDGDDPEFEDLDGLSDDWEEIEDEGDDSEGDDSEGDDSEGDDSEGDDSEGDDSEGDDSEGDDAEGDDSEGDDAEGDDAEGDDSEGDDAEGDDSEGDGSQAEGAAQDAAEEGEEDDDWEVDGETFEEGGGYMDLGRDFESDQSQAEEILDGDESDGVMTNQTALDEALAEGHQRFLKDLEKGERVWNPYNPMLDEARIVRTDNTPKELKDANKMLSEVQSSVTYLRARLRTIVRAQEMTDITHGVRRGRKMSSRMMVDTAVDLRSGRMPSRAYQITDAQVDTSIDMAICLDQSSSMKKMKRKVAQVMMVLADSVESVKGHTFAFGFRNGEYSDSHPRNWNQTYHRVHGIRYDIFKTWEENFINTKARFAHTTAYGSTPMSDGVEFGLHTLQNRQAAHRILAVITDGAPDHPHADVIRRQIRLADEAGIRIIGIGIGANATYVRSLFGEGNSVWAPTVQEMPKELLKKLNELCDFGGRFRGRRAKLDGKGKITRKVS